MFKDCKHVLYIWGKKEQMIKTISKDDQLGKRLRVGLGMAGLVGSGGGKWRKLYLNNNIKLQVEIAEIKKDRQLG